MSQLESQGELTLARKANSVLVPIEMVRSKRTAAQAFTLACDASGLDDKEIYLQLDIDAGYFSNIKKGKATLQADIVNTFCAIVDNNIYVEWLAYQVGCQLVQIESETERQLRIAREEIAMLKHDKRVLTEALRGSVAA
jgi:hypothetical protein